MTLSTSYWAKPIPDRRYDWSAWDDDTYEGVGRMGWGRTEQEAVEDLLEGERE